LGSVLPAQNGTKYGIVCCMIDPHEQEVTQSAPRDNPDTVFYLGRLSSKNIVELNVPYIISPDGAIGVAASQVRKISAEIEADEILWVRSRGDTSEEDEESHGEIKPTELADERIVIDHEKKEVYVEGKNIHLQPKHYLVLELLATRPGFVFSRKQILEDCWGDSGFRSGATVNVAISNVRKALGEDLARVIGTKRGFGFYVQESFRQTSAE